ncbi:MAG TPA: ABC transporter ATP-binding protein [Gaiellaceae bacterium]|nr:ABC transporter ATP-binding protein [Gaiellaceae bacterium]
MTEAAILARSVHKTYGALTFERRLRRIVSGGSPRAQVHALRGVSFDVPRGEVLGLVGSNGAGKSTLLRLIAGVSKPTNGSIAVHGNVHAVLEIATGLLLDRTGRENIHYMGGLYGATAEELREREPAIVEFAGLGAFIDHPVRAYSSGMRSRLAFSIVTSGEFDVLLIDEALSVGDVGFALRCRQRIRELCRRGATVVLVSHALESIREMCDRVIWLHEGRIGGDGDPDEVVEAYRAVAHEQAQREYARRFALLAKTSRHGSGVDIRRLVGTTAPGAAATHLFRLDEPFVIEASVSSRVMFDRVRAELELLRGDGVLVFRDEQTVSLAEGETALVISLGSMRLGRFTYRARLSLTAPDGAPLALGETAFAVEDHVHAYNSAYYQEVEWSLSA